jgi:hypothetical protein
VIPFKANKGAGAPAEAPSVRHAKTAYDSLPARRGCRAMECQRSTGRGPRCPRSMKIAKSR